MEEGGDGVVNEWKYLIEWDGIMKTIAKLITAEEFMDLPDPIDGSRQELIRGKVVTMPPAQGPHGYICLAIGSLIFQHARANRLGSAFSNDTGVVLERNPDTVRGPDVAYWSYERLPKVPPGYIEIAPDLAVEVLSPSNRASKIRQKTKAYFANGTRQVWVINPKTRTVRVFRSPAKSTLLVENDALEGEDVLPGFRCDVADLFPPD
jgi:Uma2 family endonuclease